MGMYISISAESGWDGSGGVFDCIVEATRGLFSKEDEVCKEEIYRPLDEQGQSFIALDAVPSRCFNVFYKKCKIAMDNFSESDRGRLVPPEHVAGILWNWGEVLRLMREDPRYTPDMS